MMMHRKHSLVHLLATAVLASPLACGASQAHEERGEVFCESYEDAFMGQCRQNCEATTEGDSQEVGKQCTATCSSDLKEDDTFADSCEKRAKEL